MKESSWFKFYEEGVRKTFEIDDVSLYDMFANSVKNFPDNPAIIFGGKTWTYAQMNQEVDQLANALLGLGVKPKDRISINGPNSANWIISFFAIMKVGAIVVQTNPLYVENELKALLNDSGAIGMITVGPLYPRVQAIRGETSLKWVLVEGLKAMGMAEDEGTLDFHACVKDAKEVEWTKPEISPQKDVAVLQYTGGTTGLPKGAQLTHSNLYANALQVVEWTKAEPGKERSLCVIPLFHIYALSVCLTSTMLAGGAIIPVPKFDADLILQLINDAKPTQYPGTPTMYVALVNHPKIKEYDVSSIKSCVSGSAPLPVEVAIRFGELTGGKLVEGYGLSEASPVTHINPMGNARVGSIGIPVSNTEAKIVDIETGEKELSPGEVGELAVKGPQVMLGYWQKENETRAVLRDGWLYTGDLAHMDEDGFFYIVDRKKDMIISGGYNVYPRDIEEVLYAHPAVMEAVCAGIPDSYWGEMVKAYVVLREGQNASEEELIEYMKTKLASYKVPKQVEIRSELPKTAEGKVLRRFLIEEEKAKLAGE
ncbi:MAG: long-chain fatty acid--CoA ligase [Desulfitobacterium sp.]|nr:long-chain fatty acid--CoA ligase [Desulfitobacterium sp.]